MLPRELQSEFLVLFLATWKMGNALSRESLWNRQAYLHIRKPYLLFHTSLLPCSLGFFHKENYVYYTITSFYSFCEPTVIFLFWIQIFSSKGKQICVVRKLVLKTIFCILKISNFESSPEITTELLLHAFIYLCIFHSLAWNKNAPLKQR